MKLFITLRIAQLLLVSTLLSHEVTASANSRKKVRTFVDMKLRNGLYAGDVFAIRGSFMNKRFLQVRFISPRTVCSGGRRTPRSKPTCQPLVVSIFTRRNLMRVSYVGKTGTRGPVPIANKTLSLFGLGRNFHLKITMKTYGYIIAMNNRTILAVRDRMAKNEIHRIRAYGGRFDEFYLKRTRNPFLTPSCGARPGFGSHTYRVIGGSHAKAAEVPWQAALRFKEKNEHVNFHHVCGAVLIDSCWVITSAHCVNIARFFPRKFLIRVGDYYNGEEGRYSSYEDSQDLEIAEIIRHPDYTINSEGETRNDIALIRLQSNSSTCARFGPLVQPICLPTSADDFPASSTCLVSGWGASSQSQRHPSQYLHHLRVGNLTIRDHAECKRLNGMDADDRTRFAVADHTVCASRPGVDTCEGDSGGPLSCSRQGRPFVLWGITSWGKGCDHPTIPGVYMKISSFMNWIKSTMNTGSNRWVYRVVFET